MCDERKLEDAYAQQEVCKGQILKYKNVISALGEFICKRTEIAVSSLQMPNVKIKLFDVVRSTGEVINVFKFTYNCLLYTSPAGSRMCWALGQKTGAPGYPEQPAGNHAAGKPISAVYPAFR